MTPSCRHNPWLPQGKPSSQNAFLRRDFVAQCVDRLRPAHAAPQHPQSAAPSLLIQGPWGGGKTMMAGAIAEQLAKKPDKLPVLLPQDLPHVLNLGGFFMEALHLLLPPDNPDLRKVMEEAYPGAQRGKALDLLEKIARSQGKTLVLIADDLDVLLIQQAPNQEANLLKQILTYEPWLSMVGTIDDANASRFPAELKSFFTVLRLEPLNDQETIALWREAVDREPLPVESALCRCLCRGNPRLSAFLADSCARDPFADPVASFLYVLDRHTPYYKGLLQELPAVERKVYAALADEWAPAAARAIARKADMDVNKASSLLNRLVKRGRVRVTGKQGRVKSYELDGPANNLNYLARTGSGHFQQVMGLCLFLEAFCLEDIALPLTSEKDSAGETGPPTAEEPPEAPLVRRPPSFSSLAEAPLSPPEPERQPPPSSVNFAHPPNPPSPGPDDAAGWTELAKFFEAQGLFEDAVQAYTKTLSIQPDHPWAWGRLGQLLRTELHLYEDAENAYLQAIEKDANQAWIWAGLGRLLHENLKNYVEAEQAYRIAIELEPRSSEFRVCMGRLHEKLERGQSALRAYEEAANIEPDNPLAFIALAEFLEKQGKKPEAGQAYQSAAECRPNDAKGWALIGRILTDKLGDAPKAKSAFEKALSMEPACFDAWEGLVLLEGLSGSPEQALSLARAFLEDFGSNPLQAKKLLDVFSNQELSPMLPQVKIMLGMEEPEGLPAAPPPPEEIHGDNRRDDFRLADPPAHPGPAEKSAAPPPPSSHTEPPPHSSAMEAFKDALLALENKSPPPIRKLAKIIQAAMALTAQGMGEAVADLLKASPLLYCLLPLWAGIMLYLKKEANVCAEARAIAREAAQRIRSAERTAAL